MNLNPIYLNILLAHINIYVRMQKENQFMTIFGARTVYYNNVQLK